MSRAELDVLGNALNLTIANYANDSNLEQAVIYALSNLTTTASASTVATTAAQAARLSGGKNI